MSNRVRRPFWLHQAAEYLIGAALVAQGLQSPTPAVPTVAGGLVLINAAITVGPLAAFRVVGRRVHRIADLVVIGAIAVGAIAPWWDLDSGTRLIMVGIAAALAMVWWYSDFSAPVARRAARAASVAPGGRSEDLGRTAGRLVGNSVNALKRRRERRSPE